jgi:hypothetical protein
MKQQDKTFDIVFPVGPNETPIIEGTVTHAKKHIKNYNKIYLITSDKHIKVDGCVTIHESVFPFSKEDIDKLLPTHWKPSWVYQQLLKLYSLEVITDLKDDILIIDADVYVLNDLEFFDKDKEIFTVGYEYTNEYHAHAEKLHPTFKRFDQRWSGVSHHMMFNRQKMKHLFKLVEEHHSKRFFEVFFENLDSKCSEYEIYFSFVCHYYYNEIKIRELRWANVPYYEKRMKEKYDYISHAKWFGTR